MSKSVRRETINDAQLYGFGRKRLEKKLRNWVAQDTDKAVKYYINSMVFIRKNNCKPLLNVFDKKVAKLFDLKTFQPIQDLIYSSDIIVHNNQKIKKSRTTTVALVNKVACLRSSRDTSPYRTLPLS